MLTAVLQVTAEARASRPAATSAGKATLPVAKQASARLSATGAEGCIRSGFELSVG